MKLTIFGGTGGVGSQLIPLALDAGHDVTAFARNPAKLPRRYRVFADRVPSPKISQGDVADLMLKCAAGDEWVLRAPIPGY